MSLKKTSLAALAALLATGSAQAYYGTYDAWEENYTVQALLGAVQYEKLKFDLADGQAEADLSLIPQLGAGWGTLPRGDRFQYGLECSFLLGFMADDVRARFGGGSAYVTIHTSMWMFDLAGGPYASLFLDKNRNIRIYAAAGPLLAYASYNSRSDDDEASIPENVVQDASAFGIGVYARTGFEFRIYEAGMLGLGVRGSWANIDFSDVGGSSDLTGLAAFISFTAGL